MVEREMLYAQQIFFGFSSFLMCVLCLCCVCVKYQGGNLLHSRKGDEKKLNDVLFF